MDYDNPQFVAAVKKIASAPLEAIASALHAIANGLHQQNTAIKEAANSYHENQRSPRLRTELYVPPADRYKKEANDARKSIVGIPKVFLEIFGFMVLVAYTTFAAFQWAEMRKSTAASAEASKNAAAALAENTRQFDMMFGEVQAQTTAQGLSAHAANNAVQAAERNIKAAEDSFRDDQRAWIGLEKFDVLQFDSKLPFKVQFIIRNTGKTPALHAKFGHAFCIYARRPEPPYDIIFPAIKGPCGDYEFQEVGAIPPSAEYHLTGDEGPPLYPDPKKKWGEIMNDFQLIRMHLKVVYMYGRITYRDVSDRPHQTDFCIYMSDPLTNTLFFCDHGNEMD
jgi:hypothetical protein